MCGIAGIVDYGAGFGRDRLGEIALAMRDSMVHRGPDDAGIWINPRGTCALAHRRLSIIDLRPEGRQPMGNEDGALQVVFNGEIYNFLALRAELEQAGHRFRSRTDSEILPHLFEDLNAEALGRLDGMFAFAAWHEPSQRLLLARDPFGKKPLYYADGPGWFAFASELQALHRVPGLDTTLDPEAMALYLLLQYVPAPRTIHRGAAKLEAGSYRRLDFASGRAVTQAAGRYFAFEPGRRPAPRRSHVETREQLRALVIEAVRKRLISDVPLGAFLSGGVDSSLVAAVVTKELGLPLKTFSIGFADTNETEHHYARQVAEHLGTDHHEEILKPDATALVTDVAAMLDEPNGDGSCLPTYLLSRFMRRQVTVALSGDGGDELFGGYGRYRDTLREVAWWKNVKRFVRTQHWMTAAESYLSPRWFVFQPETVGAMMGGLPPSVAQSLREWRRELDDPSRPLIHRLRDIDTRLYMPGAVLAKVDRMSMQTSLEVRCPLLDREVARFAADLPADECWHPPDGTKPLLKELAATYMPRAWMTRPKMGFGFPSNAWSMEGLTSMLHDLLTASDSRLAGALDRPALVAQVERQRIPGCFSIFQVWPLLILELWLRKASAPSATTHRLSA